MSALGLFGASISLLCSKELANTHGHTEDLLVGQEVVRTFALKLYRSYFNFVLVGLYRKQKII